MWVSACYTKKTKEIQRSRRERARSENERRLHRSTTTTTTTEGETDGRASSSSPPFSTPFVGERSSKSSKDINMIARNAADRNRPVKAQSNCSVLERTFRENLNSRFDKNKKGKFHGPIHVHVHVNMMQWQYYRGDLSIRN